MLGLERVTRTTGLQKFRRKGGDARKAQRLTLGQGVPDAQLAVVGNADDIACPSLFGQFAVRGEEHHGVRDRHGFLGAHMVEFHTALEMARDEPHESHAVTMLGVHIGLHLEHKARNFRLFRGHFARLRRLDLWLGAIFGDAIHQFLHAKGIDRRAEPDRSERSLQKGVTIQRWQQFTRHLDFFAQFGEHFGGDVIIKTWVIKPLHLDRFRNTVAIRAIHQFQPIMQQVIAA